VEDQESLNPSGLSDNLVPKRLRSYDLLMRQSRKMGGLAARTYDLTKEFLRQDVSALHPDRILFGATKPNEPSTFSSRQANVPDKSVPEATPDEPGSDAAKTSEGIREGEERDATTVDAKDSLNTIIQKSHQILAGAQTVILPMNLFPDSVVVDRTKVTLTKRTFFWTSSVISIRIEDVLNVSVNTGPLFGSLTISSRVMNSTDHYETNYFWRKDAIYLKQIIQGYVIAQHNKIETSHLERQELINTLLELGRDSGY
jgi:hypothetical protein